MPRLYPGWKRLVGNPGRRLIFSCRWNPISVFFPSAATTETLKTLPWLSEQELTGLFPGRLEGYRSPDHTGSGTKTRLFSVFSYYFKDRRPAFPLQAVKACKKGPIGLRWADLVWESPTIKRCCLHLFDTSIKKVLNNPEMLFCSLSIGCKKNPQIRHFQPGSLVIIFTSRFNISNHLALRCS